MPSWSLEDLESDLFWPLCQKNKTLIWRSRLLKLSSNLQCFDCVLKAFCREPKWSEHNEDNPDCEEDKVKVMICKLESNQKAWKVHMKSLIPSPTGPKWWLNVSAMQHYGILICHPGSGSWAPTAETQTAAVPIPGSLASRAQINRAESRVLRKQSDPAGGAMGSESIFLSRTLKRSQGRYSLTQMAFEQPFVDVTLNR